MNRRTSSDIAALPIVGEQGEFTGSVGGMLSFQGSRPAGSPGQGPGGGAPGMVSGAAGSLGTYVRGVYNQSTTSQSVRRMESGNESL